MALAELEKGRGFCLRRVFTQRSFAVLFVPFYGITISADSYNVLDYDKNMPKLYEYLGITIFFYSNEHEPVHVHGRYQGFESKIEIVIENGQVKKLNILSVRRKKPLPTPQLKDFEELVGALADEIVSSWISYFVYNKKIVAKKIQGKIS